MSNRTINICKLVLLVAILIPLCVIGYRVGVKGSMNMSLFTFSNKAVYQESFKNVDSVDVDVASCPVEVNVHSGADTVVTISRVGLGRSTQNMPKAEMKNGVLTITEPIAVLSLSVSGYEIDITVPKDSVMDYSLHSVSGSVRLNAASGTAKLKTTSGSVRCTASVREMNAESVSGSIKIWGDDRMESCMAATTSGSVKVKAGRNIRDISASSTSGSVKISIPEELGYILNAKSVSASVKDEYRDIDYGKGGANTQGDGTVKINASTVSGSIKLEDWDD